MSDGNWMTGCVVLSHCDLCSTSHCSLKTIYCHHCKPAQVEMDGGQKRKSCKRTGGRKEKWGRGKKRKSERWIRQQWLYGIRGAEVWKDGWKRDENSHFCKERRDHTICHFIFFLKRDGQGEDALEKKCTLNKLTTLSGKIFLLFLLWISLFQDLSSVK